MMEVGNTSILQGQLVLTNGSFVNNGVVEIKHEVVDLDEIEQVETPLVVASVPHVEEPLIIRDNSCKCFVEELLTKSYNDRDFSRTLEIIRIGRPKPLIPVSNDNFAQSSRLFKEQYYEKVDWLTGCMAIGRLYCWPCLLFDRTPALWNRTGFEDIANFHKAFKRHENSQNHIVASMQLVAFVLNHCERTMYDTEEINASIRCNRDALKKVVEAVCATGVVRSNGINTKQLLRLARCENTTLGSIPLLHLGIVKAVTVALTKSLIDILKDSPFVSLFLDEIEGRFAAVFRYTNPKGELRDSFAGFFEGTDLNTTVENLQTKYKIKGKLVALMLGASRRSETLPTDPKLTVLHSPAHRISYVLPFALQHIKECSSFFHIIQCFDTWLKDPQVEEAIKARLPISNVAKWKERPVAALHEQKELVQDIIHTMLDKPNSWRTAPYTAALALQQSLKDLEFTFLLKVFKELLPVADALLDMVMTNSPNVKVCAETVEDYLKVLNWKKEKFLEIWESMQEVDLDGPSTKKPRHGGSSKLLTYYRTLYETIVDAVVAQVKLRFASISSLEFIELLEMKNTDQVSIAEKHMVMLRSKRDCFESARLRNELIVAYAQVDFRGLYTEQLLRHLYDTGLGDPLRQVTRLARLILMYPYASRTNYDSIARLFGKIHNFSQKIISDPEILDWAVLAMENRHINKLLLSPLFLEKAVQAFADDHPQAQLNLIEQQVL